jgi:YggT family protein
LGIVAASLLLALLPDGFRRPPSHIVGSFITFLCLILTFAVFVRALLSWFPLGGYNQLVFVLDDATEPLLRPMRRIVPLIGRFDVTPLIAILILSLIPAILNLALGI